jgi:hypothetical protein
MEQKNGSHMIFIDLKKVYDKEISCLALKNKRVSTK